ncbi:MAG: hypothetical protein H0V76_10290 [Blastocatellia bacterium]|nr:hypothetical protein [Blastocatellia bacterium]
MRRAVGERAFTYYKDKKEIDMARMILAVVAGFVGWSILWLGSDQVLRIASPGWYGAHQAGIERAMTNGEPMMADSTILLIPFVP